MKFTWLNIFFIVFGMVLSGCTTSDSGKDKSVDIGGNRSKNSQVYTISSTGGVYKVGNPYKIFGTMYYPKEDYKYSETGTASWYGKDFHAKDTANGEKYNMNSLTAAHRTLPLPSIVKVTNLENGRTVILRVNDRGPYAKNRIIDISKRGAEILGFQTKGTARVKVEIMAEESKKLKEAMLNKTGKKTQTSSSSYTKQIKETVKESASDLGPKYVQAGSFSNYDSAQNLKVQLSKFGKTFVHPIMVDGNKFYRVRIGPFKYKGEAELTLNKVRDYGIYNAKIVSN